MKQRFRSLFPAIALMLILSCAGLSAQDATAAEPDGSQSIGDYWTKGGWAMWPLLFLSVSGVGLIAYNAMMIRQKVLAPKDSINQLQQLTGTLDIDGINNYCENTNNPITNVFAAGIERITPEDFDPEAIRDAMDDAAAEELAAPYTMVNYLNVVSNVAPLVGMLGTVSGMVKAFGSIAASGGMADPAEMANNISEALITTASGLIVAIPTMLGYFFFKNKYGKIVASMTRSLGDIYYTLVVTVRNPEAAYAAAETGEEEYYEEEAYEEEEQ